MKKITSLMLTLVSISFAYTQDLPSQGGVSNNIIGHSAFTEAFDPSGKPLTEVNKKVAGSVLLSENWGIGQVRFQNGFLLKNVALQFDLYQNELHFRKNDIVYLFVDPLKDFTMEFKEGEEVRSVTFRSGYPAIQQKTDGSFYQVVADGSNVQLLNYISKEIRENYTYAGPVKNEYQEKNTYFIYDLKSGVIKNFNFSKASLLKALPVYANAIKKFADDKNYKFKSENEVNELFTVLNSL